MNKLYVNILMNVVLTVFAVLLSNWIVQKNFEETYISATFVYGLIIMFANALFIRIFCKK